MAEPRDSDLPLVQPLPEVPNLELAYHRLSRLPHCLFLDSVRPHPVVGRYSYLAADPWEFTAIPAGIGDTLTRFRERWATWRTARVPGLPPFQGGAGVLLSYDLNRSLEQIPPPQFDEFQVPGMALAMYDVVLAVDHFAQRAWLVSQGLPAEHPPERRQRACARLAELAAILSGTGSVVRSPASRSPRPDPVPAARLAPQHRVAADGRLTSTFSRTDYCRMIRRAVDYIHAGDVFQVNLAQRLLYPACDTSESLYVRLRRCNPAPFAASFDLGDFQVLSASPELFLSVRDGLVETRPIKGTRLRCPTPEADLSAAADLLASAKDRAENVMIVDLLRNDLARVCRPESVQVTQLCGLERYQYVQHLVSVVRGRLRRDQGVWDLIGATFPGGSVTGAPKVRAMEIIAELEPTARGPYCGALGYVGLDGTADLNILIRTITAGRGWWQLPVGGGIVADSVPQHEYEETWHKAHGLLRALPHSWTAQP